MFACPYAAFLRYEAGMRSKTTDALALGNSLHLALEEGHKQPEWSLDFVGNKFLTEYRRIIEDEEVYVTWPKMKKQEAEGLEMLELFTRGIEQGKIPAIPYASEKEFKLPFEDEIVVVGKIDRIDFDDDGEYIVIDYKSGSREPDAWFLDHDLQFTTYAWAGYELFGKLPKELRWHHLRNGKQLVTHRTMKDIEELQRMLHNALEMNRRDIRYRIYHSQVCNWCEFKGAVCDDRELETQLLTQRKELLNGSEQQ